MENLVSVYLYFFFLLSPCVPFESFFLVFPLLCLLPKFHPSELFIPYPNEKY